MACRLNIRYIYLLELLNIIKDPLKLNDKGIQLFLAEMESCQIRNFQHFCARDSQIQPSLQKRVGETAGKRPGFLYEKILMRFNQWK